MKTKILIYSLFLMGMFLMLMSNCKKDDSVPNNPSVSVPVLTTTAISSVTSGSATSGGNITSIGGSTITERGVCWGIKPTPIITDRTVIKTSDGTGIGIYTSNLTGLNGSTLYYIRSYATNSKGTGYGNELSFTTSSQPTVTDIDGNIYHTVNIGTQVWMVENLNVSRYRNGDSIPNITDNTQWQNLKTGACCDYLNTPSYSSIYGKIYNGYAVLDQRNMAPTGWHVATHAEWITLTTYVGGISIAGGKLKETGTTHWDSPNTDATNEYGFTALPGGWRTEKGSFQGVAYRNTGYWWTSSVAGNRWEILCNTAYTSWIYNIPEQGFHARCIKDN